MRPVSAKLTVENHDPRGFALELGNVPESEFQTFAPPLRDVVLTGLLGDLFAVHAQRDASLTGKISAANQERDELPLGPKLR